MDPRICICCGEPMMEHGNARSRNPNLCASCSSMADGMEESNLPVLPEATVVARHRRAPCPPAPAPSPRISAV